MSNITIDVNIHAPELVQAINHLADSLGKPAAVVREPITVTTAQKPAAPAQAVPAAPTPVAPPTALAAPTAVPVAAAPVCQTPTYTVDQLQIGAGQVMQRNPAAAAQLQQLLVKYGVQRLPELSSEQIGLFAADLRGLGAQI